jgi:hypothetical protein
MKGEYKEYEVDMGSIPGVTTTSPMSTRLEGVSTRLEGVSTRLLGVSTRLVGVNTKLLWVNTRLVGGSTNQKLFPKGVRGSITELCCLKSQNNRLTDSLQGCWRKYEDEKVSTRLTEWVPLLS